MDLFDSIGDAPIKLISHQGCVDYYAKIMSQQQSNQYLEQLLNEIAWQNDQAIIYGKHITTKRKVAWYGDKPFSYTYSNTTKQALPWIAALIELKHIAEQTFNSCLLSLYHNGNEGMAWCGVA